MLSVTEDFIVRRVLNLEVCEEKHFCLRHLHEHYQ